MKKINKAQPPKSFSEFVKKEMPIHWSECNSDVKSDSKETMLLYEQDFLCGYTEIFIDNEDCHIDHYVKRSIDNRLCYVWENLIVAVNDDEFGAKYKDNGENCIKMIGDYSSIVNPVLEEAQYYFKYSLDGQIDPADELDDTKKLKANRTIEVFYLNHQSLKTRRKDIAYAIKALNDGGVETEAITKFLEQLGFHSFTNYILDNYFNKY